MPRASISLPLVWLALAACSSPSTAHPDAAMPDAAKPAGFVLTSAAFADGAAIPAANTCAAGDSSPALSWTGAPTGTAAFAVVLTDTTLRPPLIHWVIYDIPKTATGLPAGIDKVYAPTAVAGAHQTAGYDDITLGYLGPCPPAQHTYQFALYPLLATPLPGATMTTTRSDAVNFITAHQLTPPATLSGTYKP